jgi:hypothetical protein
VYSPSGRSGGSDAPYLIGRAGIQITALHLFAGSVEYGNPAQTGLDRLVEDELDTGRSLRQDFPAFG